MENTIEIYTDGGARPSNPGPGANAFCYVLNGTVVAQHSAFAENATNNQMELEAVINALQYYQTFINSSDYNTLTTNKVVVYTDSQYVQKGITEWISGWIKRGWLTSTREPVKNKELWINLLDASEILRNKNVELEFKWVKAHNNNPHNELVDSLCTSLILKNQ